MVMRHSGVLAWPRKSLRRQSRSLGQSPLLQIPSNVSFLVARVAAVECSFTSPRDLIETTKHDPVDPLDIAAIVNPRRMRALGFRSADLLRRGLEQGASAAVVWRGTLRSFQRS